KCRPWCKWAWRAQLIAFPSCTPIRNSRSRCRSRYPTSTLTWSMWDSMLRGHSRIEERNLRPSRSREQRLGQISAKAEEAPQCDGLRAFTIAIGGTAGRSLVQLLANVFDPFGEKLASQLALGFDVQDLFRGGDCGFGGGTAGVRRCL